MDAKENKQQRIDLPKLRQEDVTDAFKLFSQNYLMNSEGKVDVQRRFIASQGTLLTGDTIVDRKYWAPQLEKDRLGNIGIGFNPLGVLVLRNNQTGYLIDEVAVYGEGPHYTENKYHWVMPDGVSVRYMFPELSSGYVEIVIKENNRGYNLRYNSQGALEKIGVTDIYDNSGVLGYEIGDDSYIKWADLQNGEERSRDRIDGTSLNVKMESNSVRIRRLRKNNQGETEEIDTMLVPMHVIDREDLTNNLISEYTLEDPLNAEITDDASWRNYDKIKQLLGIQWHSIPLENI